MLVRLGWASDQRNDPVFWCETTHRMEVRLEACLLGMIEQNSDALGGVWHGEGARFHWRCWCYEKIDDSTAAQHTMIVTFKIIPRSLLVTHFQQY